MGHKQVTIADLPLSVSEEKVVLTLKNIRVMEDFLNESYLPAAMPLYQKDYDPQTFAMSEFGVPSLLVRIDMSPMRADDTHVGAYEVDASPAGVGVMAALGVDLLPIAKAFKGLGINEIGYATTMSRGKFKGDHELGVKTVSDHGIKIWPIDINHQNGFSGPLWLRAGHENIELVKHLLPRQIILSYHWGGHKRYLLNIGNARLLSECRAVAREFPEGCVVKPWNEWGSHGVMIWAAKPPYRKESMTLSRLDREIEIIIDHRKEDSYLVQPFHPPEYLEKERLFRNWRILAVWTRDGYQVVGVAWNARNSLLLHGASDTLWGSILKP
jgi:hypothetical protein